MAPTSQMCYCELTKKVVWCFFAARAYPIPAGLPDFKGLVRQIYARTDPGFTDVERVAYKNGQYDSVLDMFERRVVGHRMAVRCALADVLKPKLRRKGAIDTQAALLRLARSRDGALRLVTTNFDRLFHEAAKRINQEFQAYAAPMSPIPKSSRWDGLVFLHGLLPEKTDATALNRSLLHRLG